MKNLKLFVVVMAAMAILMPSAGVHSASATELTCGVSMCAAETTIKAASDSAVVLDAPFGNIECTSTIEGHTTNTGGSTETVTIAITGLTFEPCNSGNTFHALKKGSWEIHTQEANDNNNGIVTWTGAELEWIHLGVQCIFTTSSTALGTLTGAVNAGGSPTLDINATIPRTGGSGGAFCGSSAPWTGSYRFNAPSTLNIDQEVKLSGGPGTGAVDETTTVTWKNNTEGAMTIEDEDISVGGVAETLGTSCGTIAATSSCTSRKVKCLKKGEATITAADTPSIEGKFVIKCD